MTDFLMGLSRPARIILVSHDGCVRYQTSYEEQMSSPGFSLKEQQIHDLTVAAANLGGRYAGAKVEEFFAARAEDNALIFEPIQG